MARMRKAWSPLNPDFCGGRGGGRTHTKSELRQILSLVRLPVPPFRPGTSKPVYIKALPETSRWLIAVRLASAAALPLLCLGIYNTIRLSSDVPEAEFDDQFAVNARGTFFGVQKMVPIMRDGGSIVVVGSAVAPDGGGGIALQGLRPVLSAPIVLACSRAAWALGVRLGMTATTARALSPEVNTLATVYAMMIYDKQRALPIEALNASSRQLIEGWRSRNV